VNTKKNVIPGIKSRKVGWVGHVVRMGKERMNTGFRWENMKRAFGNDKGGCEDNT
jgi:hypothetical protein